MRFRDSNKSNSSQSRQSQSNVGPGMVQVNTSIPPPIMSGQQFSQPTNQANTSSGPIINNHPNQGPPVQQFLVPRLSHNLPPPNIQLPPPIHNPPPMVVSGFNAMQNEGMPPGGFHNMNMPPVGMGRGRGRGGMGMPGMGLPGQGGGEFQPGMEDRYCIRIFLAGIATEFYLLL